MIDDPVEPDEPTIEEQRDYYKALAEDLQARLKVAETALEFVADICDEALEYARVGTGEEVALRHAGRKATAALAKIRREG